MTIDRRKRIAFEEVAHLFDEIRPGYPDELIQEVLDLSGIPFDGRILEIGCGPGNSTLPYAQRGYRITAVELGKQLSSLAAQNLGQFPEVTIINSSFEDWPLEEKAFDLAISAEAMHWIPPDIGYPKVAAALKDKGSAAFYWNVATNPQTDVSRAVNKVFYELAPEQKKSEDGVKADWLTDIINNNFKQSGCFGEVEVRSYPWSKEYTTEQFIKLYRTSSIYRDLDDSTKDRLFTGIADVIERFGGKITRLNKTVLFISSVMA